MLKTFFRNNLKEKESNFYLKIIINTNDKCVNNMALIGLFVCSSFDHRSIYLTQDIDQ